MARRFKDAGLCAYNNTMGDNPWFTSIGGKKLCPGVSFSSVPQVDKLVPSDFKPYGVWLQIATRRDQDGSILSVFIVEEKSGLLAEVSRPPCVYRLYASRIFNILRYADRAKDEYVWPDFDEQKREVHSIFPDEKDLTLSKEQLATRLFHLLDKLYGLKQEQERARQKERVARLTGNNPRALSKIAELQARGLCK